MPATTPKFPGNSQNLETSPPSAPRRLPPTPSLLAAVLDVEEAVRQNTLSRWEKELMGQAQAVYGTIAPAITRARGEQRSRAPRHPCPARLPTASRLGLLTVALWRVIEQRSGRDFTLPHHPTKSLTWELVVTAMAILGLVVADRHGPRPRRRRRFVVPTDKCAKAA